MITLTDYEITVLILSSKVAIISSLIISIPAFFLGLALATKQFYGKSIIEIKMLPKKKDWQKIRAVKNDKVFITDGNQYFNRPGPRLVESLEILVEILNFKESNFKHNKTGWIKFNTVN